MKVRDAIRIIEEDGWYLKRIRGSHRQYKQDSKPGLVTMPHLPDDTDARSWHRYFAMEANNRAWALAVESRNSLEDAEMLHAAHASAWHWSIVGTELNHMRAAMLLAEVHALLTYGQTALAYAEEMRGYFLSRESFDWEIAFAHSIYAHAAYVAGKMDAYLAAYREAVVTIDAIGDLEDRKVVMRTFAHVPSP